MNHTDGINSRLAQRSQLTNQLRDWCYSHRPEIRASLIEWKRLHSTAPNALMVPSQFASVAWGAKFFGLYLITSIYNDDAPVTMPTPLHVIVPDLLAQRAQELIDDSPAPLPCLLTRTCHYDQGHSGKCT